jgi:aconitate hydratase
MIASGARILESACGPCIGMGQSPNSGGTSLRTFNRNFEGRSGTKDAQVYLVSPETAAYSAITGVLSDPTVLTFDPSIEMPKQFLVDDNMIEKPESEQNAEKLSTVKGPNIKALPKAGPIPDSLKATAALKVGDNITTDHIMPAGAKILPFRSNIPKMSEFCFFQVDAEFPKRAKELGECIIIGGQNYGQGSSREHAALVPLYLGVKAVIVKSFARMHRDNLINSGILPLEFANPEDYDKIEQGDILTLPNLKKELLAKKPIQLFIANSQTAILLKQSFTDRDIELLVDGGLLNHTAKVRR